MKTPVAAEALIAADPLALHSIPCGAHPAPASGSARAPRPNPLSHRPARPARGHSARSRPARRAALQTRVEPSLFSSPGAPGLRRELGACRGAATVAVTAPCLGTGAPAAGALCRKAASQRVARPGQPGEAPGLRCRPARGGGQGWSQTLGVWPEGPGEHPRGESSPRVGKGLMTPKPRNHPAEQPSAGSKHSS